MHCRVMVSAVGVALVVLVGCGSSEPLPVTTATTTVISTVTTASVTTTTTTETVTSTVTAEAASEDSTGGDAPDVEACSLLTPDEAEILADTPLDPPVVGGRSDTCTYNGPVSGPLAQVMVAIGAGAKKYYDIDRMLEHEFRELPDIGDEAYVQNKTAFVRKGEVWALVELVRLVDSSETEQRLIDAITLIADRY